MDEQKGLASCLCHEEYMEISFVLLDACDHICMLDGWKESKGGCQENGYARASGKHFIWKKEA